MTNRRSLGSGRLIESESPLLQCDEAGKRHQQLAHRGDTRLPIQVAAGGDGFDGSRHSGGNGVYRPPSQDRAEIIHRVES